MKDLLGALAVALIGALICASGYLNFRGAKKRARGSRRWSRASAHVTKAWKQDDDIEVMYDPEAPYNNDLPVARFALSFFPIAYGALTVFGAALTLVGLVGAAVISAALIR